MRSRCARRGAAGMTASASRVGVEVGVGVGVGGSFDLVEVATRSRPRGCRLPTLVGQGVPSDGMAPHRVNRPPHQLGHHEPRHKLPQRLPRKDIGETPHQV